MEEAGDKYFLQKVDLGGYKSIRKTAIDFRGNLSIIIGKNAAGKTNFLWFLDKVLNIDIESFYNFKSVLSFKGKRNILFEMQNNLSPGLSLPKSTFSKNEYKFIITIDGVRNEYTPQEPQWNENLDSENFNCFSTLISHGIPEKYDIVDIPFNVTMDEKGFSYDLINYGFQLQHPYFIKSLLMSFLNVGKEVNDIRKTSIESIKLRLKEYLFNGMDVIKPYLNQLSPIEDIRFSENYNIFESKANQSFTIDNLCVEFKVNGEWYPFSNLSDGTKRLFYIISEVACSENFYFKNSKFGIYEKENRRIILIEEPELGIHPHQLHTLMLFLKEQARTKQIIITTHSPQVLDILDENEFGNIILAYHENDKGTRLRHLSKEEIKKAKKYIEEDFLSDYWIHSDLEITN